MLYGKGVYVSNPASLSLACTQPFDRPSTHRLELCDIPLTTPHIRIRQRLDPPIPDRNPRKHPTRLHDEFQNMRQGEKGQEGILWREVFVEEMPDGSDGRDDVFVGEDDSFGCSGCESEALQISAKEVTTRRPLLRRPTIVLTRSTGVHQTIRIPRPRLLTHPNLTPLFSLLPSHPLHLFNRNHLQPFPRTPSRTPQLVLPSTLHLAIKDDQLQIFDLGQDFDQCGY
jgi:hypothetical protein